MNGYAKYFDNSKTMSLKAIDKKLLKKSIPKYGEKLVL